jgi:hypothetical protein
LSNKKNGEVSPTKALIAGRTDLRKLGIPLGWYYQRERKRVRWRILNVGIVQVGISNYYIGVCIGRRDIFLGRDGRLWRYDGAKLEHNVPSNLGLSEEDLTPWANAISRTIIDRLSPKNELDVIEKSNTRYRKIVLALVKERILDAATLGYEVSAETFARGVSSNWDTKDLLYPRIITLRHATVTALVLSLQANKAAQLIELAAMIEMRVPIVSREAALAIYQQSVSLLSRLCPQWWNQGYTCRWELVGDIERLFRSQYIRTLNDSFETGIQFETAGGITLNRLTNSDPYSTVDLAHEE